MKLIEIVLPIDNGVGWLLFRKIEKNLNKKPKLIDDYRFFHTVKVYQ